MNKKEVSRNIISLFLSFLLFLFLTALIVLSILQASVLNKTYMETTIKTSEYPKYVMEKVEDYLVSYGMASGFDEEFFSSVLTMDIIENDIQIDINFLFSKIDNREKSEIQPYIFDKLVQNVNERGLKINEQNKKDLNELAKICGTKYLEVVEIPFIVRIKPIISKINSFMPFLFLGTIIISAFLISFLFFINKKKTCTKYIIYSFSALLLTIILPIIITCFSNKIMTLGISDQALYMLSTTYLKGIVFYGIIFSIVIAIIISILCIIYRKKNKKC